MLVGPKPTMSSIDQVEDAGSAPLLGGRACCTHAEEVEEMLRVPYEDEGALARARRVLSCRRMLRHNEVAGSLGDLGTFLPDVVSLTNVGAHPHPESFVFFAGVWSVFAGCAYDLPMPVQPMHTVTAVSLTEGLSYAQLVAAGIWLGGIFALLGATGLIGLVQRLIPLPVVRSLQLGLGLKLVGTGIGLARRASTWADTATNLDGYVLGSLAVCIALLGYGGRRVPTSILLFGLGCVGVLWARPPLAFGLHNPFAPVPTFEAADWWTALYKAALPQLPVTLLNAVVATARLARDLYPSKPVSVRKISLSIALMDGSSCWFGHFPSCHGCGGLAGQHLFGARTGSSMAFIGVAKALLALALGPSLLPAFEAFPSTVLGVLLAVSGIELAACCRDLSEKADFAVMLVGAGIVIKVGTGIGFLGACLTAAAFKLTGAEGLKLPQDQGQRARGSSSSSAGDDEVVVPCH